MSKSSSLTSYVIRLTVNIGKSEQPTTDELNSVVARARAYIEQSAPCYVFGMDRAQAEEVYGDIMYDKAEVRAIIAVIAMRFPYVS